MKLSGVSAIVTGGASGLGAATAEALSASGVRVALWDLNEEKGEALAEKLGGVFCITNVADEDSVKASLEKSMAANGSPWILVNCAGIAVGEKTVGKNGVHNLTNFKRVLEVNLIGTFNVASQSAAGMCAQDPVNDDGERGVIINTASVAAYDGQIGQIAYSASKGGVVAMTLQAARELAREGIRVNTIAPGLFMTPMMAGFTQEVQDSLAATLPFPQRLGQPKEYGMLVEQIVKNPILNGETIRLDCALRMAPR